MRRISATVAAVTVALAWAVGAQAGNATPGATRLIIPKLHLDAPLGTVVDHGPAFYPGSGRPGQPYTIAIAGHRTTHTRPFWSLNALKPGDRIAIVWRHTWHLYRVTKSL